MSQLYFRTVAAAGVLVLSVGVFAMGSRPVSDDEAINSRITPVARVELAAPAPLNLVCFRHRGGDALNRQLLESLNREGAIYLTHTVLNGRYTLRFCVGQTHTEFRHVERAWDLIQAAATRVCGAPAA